jgi:hypothetical protein
VIQQAREYRKTSYELSSKWGVSNLNFRGIYRREVLLANVKTIELRISSFQKFFGLGNIIMRTQESGFWRSKTSICLFDIEKPEETYILVKEMVSKASKT